MTRPSCLKSSGVKLGNDTPSHLSTAPQNINWLKALDILTPEVTPVPISLNLVRRSSNWFPSKGGKEVEEYQNSVNNSLWQLRNLHFLALISPLVTVSFKKKIDISHSQNKIAYDTVDSWTKNSISEKCKTYKFITIRCANKIVQFGVALRQKKSFLYKTNLKIFRIMRKSCWVLLHGVTYGLTGNILVTCINISQRKVAVFLKH